MKKVIITIMLMQDEVLAFLTRNSAKFVGNVPLLAAITALRNRMGTGDGFKLEKVKRTKGFAASKVTNRKTLGGLTDAMRRRVQAQCSATNNEVGFVNANITYSDVVYGNIVLSLAQAQIVHDLANAMSAGDKATYMVTAGDLTALQDQINLVADLNTLRRSSVVDRKTSGKMMDDTTMETTKFIHDTIDSLMGNYRMTDAALYEGYLNSRMTVQMPGRHAEISGTVIIAGTTTPLPRVKVIATNGIKTFEDLTDTKGFYRMPVSPELYNLSFVMPSYAVGHVNDVLVDAAQHQVIDAKMVKS